MMKPGPTWAVSWRTPCHGTEVYLVWRSSKELLTWDGVPCFAAGCGKTCMVEQLAHGLVDKRVSAERLHPGLDEMTCWATRESDPSR